MDEIVQIINFYTYRLWYSFIFSFKCHEYEDEEVNVYGSVFWKGSDLHRMLKWWQIDGCGWNDETTLYPTWAEICHLYNEMWIGWQMMNQNMLEIRWRQIINGKVIIEKYSIIENIKKEKTQPC